MNLPQQNKGNDTKTADHATDDFAVAAQGFRVAGRCVPRRYRRIHDDFTFAPGELPQ